MSWVIAISAFGGVILFSFLFVEFFAGFFELSEDFQYWTWRAYFVLSIIVLFILSFIYLIHRIALSEHWLGV